MKIDEAKVIADNYYEKHFNFSALIISQKILEKEPTEYNKFRHADQLRLCGFLSEAQKMYNQIDVDRIPKKGKGNYFRYLGQFFMDCGKWKKAEEAFKKSLDLDDTSTIPYVFLAGALLPLGKNEEAIYYLKLALDKEGDIDEVYYNLATRMAIKGQMESALEFINQCIEIDPNYPNAENIRKDILEYLSIREIEIDPAGPAGAGSVQ